MIGQGPDQGEVMKIMPEKIATFFSYFTSGTLITMGWLVEWFKNIDWNQVAVISGIVIGIATFLTNFYYKRSQTKAMEHADQRGIIIHPEGD